MGKKARSRLGFLREGSAQQGNKSTAYIVQKWQAVEDKVADRICGRVRRVCKVPREDSWPVVLGYGIRDSDAVAVPTRGGQRRTGLGCRKQRITKNRRQRVEEGEKQGNSWTHAPGVIFKCRNPRGLVPASSRVHAWIGLGERQAEASDEQTGKAARCEAVGGHNPVMVSLPASLKRS